MKTDRIEARVDTAGAERIRRAAALENVSTSKFVIQAAAERADRVLQAESVTLVPTEVFDALLSALDEITPVVSLERAAARARSSIKIRR